MPRLVVCLYCRAIERMIDPPSSVRHVPAKWTVMEDGVERTHYFKDDLGATLMVPEYDPLMEDFCGRHTHNMPDTSAINYIKSFDCTQETFESANIVEELKKELAQVTGEFFEESEHYKTEALQCYNKHGNPTTQTGCSDFRADSKRIGSDKVPPRYQVYLCSMCPYMQSEIAREMRWKAGLYEPNQKIRRRRNRRR